MAWPYLDGIIKVVVTYGYEGQPAINVHFVLQDTPVTPVPDATLLAVADIFHDSFDTVWDIRASVNWQVDDVTALDWSREAGNVIQTDGTLPIVGLQAGNAIPANCAAVVSQRTARTGRSYRGRNYVGGLNVATVTDNTLNADLVTDLGQIYAVIRAGLALIDLQHVVYSLKFEGENRITPIATPITGTIVNDQVDTQRRRMPPM